MAVSSVKRKKCMSSWILHNFVIFATEMISVKYIEYMIEQLQTVSAVEYANVKQFDMCYVV